MHLYFYLFIYFRFVSFQIKYINKPFVISYFLYIYKNDLNFSILNPIFLGYLFLLNVLIFTFSSNESTENAVTTTIDNEETPSRFRIMKKLQKTTS